MTDANTNGISPELAQRHLGKVLEVYADLEAQKIVNMNTCRTIRARLPDLYEAAKLEGLPIRAFKQSVKKVLLERKIEGLEEDINALKPEDEDDAEAYELVQAALGDFAGTPLGAVTLDAAAEKGKKAAAKKAAKGAVAPEAPPATDQAAADDALVQQNTERLAGITPLPAKEPFEDDAAATSTKPSRRQQRAGLEGAESPGSYKIN